MLVKVKNAPFNISSTGKFYFNIEINGVLRELILTPLRIEEISKLTEILIKDGRLIFGKEITIKLNKNLRVLSVEAG